MHQAKTGLPYILPGRMAGAQEGKKTMKLGRLLVIIAAGILGLGESVRAQSPLEEENPPPRWEFGAEYLFLRMQAARFPVLVTKGNPNDTIPGALDQPGTSVLAGNNLGHGFETAGRISLLYWLCPTFWDVEGNFLVAEQRSKLFQAASENYPNSVIARPFFNPNVDLPDADPRSIPGLLNGFAGFSFLSRLWGGEANTRVRLTGEPGSTNLSLILGVRYLQLAEQYRGFDQVEDLPAGTGLFQTFSDTIATTNHFLGGQIGAQLRFFLDCDSFLAIQTKVAVGPVWQTVQYRGSSSLTDEGGILLNPGETVTDDQRGFYSQITNVGTRSGQRIAALPELSLQYGYDMTSSVHLRFGYTLMYLSSVVRPGDQIDTVINIQPIGSPPQEGPARPTALMNSKGLWMQWFSIGVEILF